MRVKVELNRAAAADVAGLPAADRQDFLRRLEEVAAAPITRSVVHCEPGLTFAVRRFVFGCGIARIAIFRYDLAAGRMQVLRCRVQYPRELREPKPESGTGAGPAPDK
ncbi:MAG: hypothetical protein AB1716_16920 [Planctomycetota bacterium]